MLARIRIDGNESGVAGLPSLEATANDLKPRYSVFLKPEPMSLRHPEPLIQYVHYYHYKE
jgi:hypothetical protein